MPSACTSQRHTSKHQWDELICMEWTGFRLPRFNGYRNDKESMEPQEIFSLQNLFRSDRSLKQSPLYNVIEHIGMVKVLSRFGRVV